MPSAFDPVAAYTNALQNQGAQENAIQNAPIQDFGRRALIASLLGGLGQVAQNLTGNRAYGQEGENFLYKPRIDALAQYRNHIAGLAAASKLAQAQQKLNEGAQSSEGRLLSGQAAYQHAFHPPAPRPPAAHTYVSPDGTLHGVNPATGAPVFTIPGARLSQEQIAANKLALFNAEQGKRNAARQSAQARSEGAALSRMQVLQKQKIEATKQAQYNAAAEALATGAINPSTKKPFSQADYDATVIEINKQHDQALRDLGVEPGAPTMSSVPPAGSSIDWNVLLSPKPKGVKKGTGSGSGTGSTTGDKTDENLKQYEPGGSKYKK